MSYANYCIERDLEDRKSSCFLERITSDERSTDFIKPEMMFGDTLFPLLRDLSWQEEALILEFTMWGVAFAGLQAPVSPGPVRQKWRMTQYLLSTGVFLPSVPPELWLVPAHVISHILHIACSLKYKAALYDHKIRKVRVSHVQTR